MYSLERYVWIMSNYRKLDGESISFELQLNSCEFFHFLLASIMGLFCLGIITWLWVWGLFCLRIVVVVVVVKTDNNNNSVNDILL
jgi:hypothetical protein